MGSSAFSYRRAPFVDLMMTYGTLSPTLGAVPLSRASIFSMSVTCGCLLLYSSGFDNVFETISIDMSVLFCSRSDIRLFT